MDTSIGDILRSKMGIEVAGVPSEWERQAKQDAQAIWTSFSDLHGGGGAKTDWETIYIEAPYDLAVALFRFYLDCDPRRITCPCCGEDYSVREVSGAYVRDVRDEGDFSNLFISRA